MVTRNKTGWCSTQLLKAMRKRNITPFGFSFPELVARVQYSPEVSVNEMNVLRELSALITRPIGRGSLEEIIFRMDVLHRLERFGMFIINPPRATERSVDKYYTLALLEEHGLPVPQTAVTEDPEEALKSFHDLGGDVVVKPLFGSKGAGSTRISDSETARRVFKAISFYHGVLYVQKFIPHGFTDVRAFVIGDHVVASMQRVSDTWKTNISQGGRPLAYELDEKIEVLAVEAAGVIGCRVAGVDILESSEGAMIVELNSQPGWRGLQSVTELNIADEIIEYILSQLRA